MDYDTFINSSLIIAIVTSTVALLVALFKAQSERKIREASAANSISSGFGRLVGRLQEQTEKDKVEIMELKLRLHQADELVGELQVANDVLRDV